MTNVPHLQFDTGAVSAVAVDETVFGEKILWRTLRLAVLQYEANRRQGSANTKTRAEIQGTTRKPWKQKHTGRARAGTKKSPIWRGGGTVFGPKPRSYRQEMPRRQLKAALNSALLGKVRDGEVALLGGLAIDAPSTKAVRGVLKSLDVSGSMLLVLRDTDTTVWKSFRNLPGVGVTRASDLNAYDVCRHRTVVFTDDAFEAVGGKRS